MEAAVAAVPVVLILALGATQGGFHPDTWVWSTTLAAWAVALGAVLDPRLGAFRSRWPWAAATAALAAWTLASALWSAAPAQSVLEARRALLYVAVVAALLVLARRAASRLLVLATHGAITALLAYALARYLLGTRHYDTFESFLLSQPLGYANAVGILAAVGLLLALGTAAGPARERAVAAGSAPILALALAFADSTGSWLALGLGAAVVIACAQSPLRALAAAGLVAWPAALAVALARLSRFDEIVAKPRLPGGAVVAVVALLALAAAAVAVRVRLPEATPRGRRLLVAGAVVLVLAAGIGGVAKSGSTEPRASYWHIAWHEYRAHPVLGSGAGTFGRYWVDSGLAGTRGGALDAHSLYLETLAELGPLGLLLLAAMLLAPIRRPLGPYAAAALGGYAAFLVHAGLDWDWELPAVVVAALCCAAAVTAPGASPERASPRLRVALVAAALAVAAAGIVGARSSTEPGTTKAPQSGAFVQTRVRSDGYLP